MTSLHVICGLPPNQKSWLRLWVHQMVTPINHVIARAGLTLSGAGAPGTWFFLQHLPAKYRRKPKKNHHLSAGLLALCPVPSLRGARGAGSSTSNCLCPPFQFTQNTFLEHHVTTRQQAKIEKGIITFKDNSRLKFFRFFAKLLSTNYCI